MVDVLCGGIRRYSVYRLNRTRKEERYVGKKTDKSSLYRLCYQTCGTPLPRADLCR